MKSSQQTFHLKGKKFLTSDLLKVFETETTYQVDRLADYLRKFEGKSFKIVITPARRPKSSEALGMYFGAIVPATAKDWLNLPYDVEKVYEDYKYYKNLGKAHKRHLDAADNMLRLEWHHSYTRRLDGTLYRTPKDLSSQDNEALLNLIEKVVEWRAQNGYPYIDVERYKEIRDDVQLL